MSVSPTGLPLCPTCGRLASQHTNPLGHAFGQPWKTGEPNPRCVRCFAPYAADGSCSRRAEGCQGGRGEWVAAAAEIAEASNAEVNRG